MNRHLITLILGPLYLLVFAVSGNAYTANPNLSAGGTNAGLVSAGTLGYTVLSSSDGTAVLQARSTTGITDEGGGYYVITGGVTFSGASVLVKWDRSDTGAVLGIGTSSSPAQTLAPAPVALALTITHNSSNQPILTWVADPLATLYLEERSTDGVTYTVFHTDPPGTLTDTDTARPNVVNVYYHVVSRH